MPLFSMADGDRGHPCLPGPTTQAEGKPCMDSPLLASFQSPLVKNYCTRSILVPNLWEELSFGVLIGIWALFMLPLQDFRQKDLFLLYWQCQRLTVWITINCGKFWKGWEYQTTWPASWEICMQVRMNMVSFSVYLCHHWKRMHKYTMEKRQSL